MFITQGEKPHFLVIVPMSYAMKISEISETKENYKYFLSNKNVLVKKKEKGMSHLRHNQKHKTATKALAKREREL